ncbi:hypothetical protein LAHI110946_09680 [Lactococcus hircilactis]
MKKMPYYVREYCISRLSYPYSICTIDAYLCDFQNFFEWMVFKGYLSSAKKVEDVSLNELNKLKKTNVVIRRFLPKGTIKTTVRAVARIEKWMNNYPRKLFNYKSPTQMVRGG